MNSLKVYGQYPSIIQSADYPTDYLWHIQDDTLLSGVKLQVGQSPINLLLMKIENW